MYPPCLFVANQGLRHRTVKVYIFALCFMRIQAGPFAHVAWLLALSRLCCQRKVEVEKEVTSRTRLPITSRTAGTTMSSQVLPAGSQSLATVRTILSVTDIGSTTPNPLQWWWLKPPTQIRFNTEWICIYWQFAQWQEFWATGALGMSSSTVSSFRWTTPQRSTKNWSQCGPRPVL